MRAGILCLVYSFLVKVGGEHGLQAMGGEERCLLHLLQSMKTTEKQSPLGGVFLFQEECLCDSVPFPLLPIRLGQLGNVASLWFTGFLSPHPSAPVSVAFPIWVYCSWNGVSQTGVFDSLGILHELY